MCIENVLEDSINRIRDSFDIDVDGKYIATYNTKMLVEEFAKRIENSKTSGDFKVLFFKNIKFYRCHSVDEIYRLLSAKIEGTSDATLRAGVFVVMILVLKDVLSNERQIA